MYLRTPPSAPDLRHRTARAPRSTICDLRKTRRNCSGFPNASALRMNISACPLGAPLCVPPGPDSNAMRQDLFTQDHYRVLGVAPDASHDQIRKAYLKLVKQHHPDVSKGSQSAEQFKAIASAWEVMGDKSKRGLYDERMGDAVFRRRTEHRSSGPGAESRGQRWSRGAERGNSRMPPVLRAFELATHPRVLMVGIPLACVGYMLFGDHDTEEPTTTKVDAWHNPATKRWETPAPWNAEFQKRRHLVEKVDRSIVHEAGRRN